MMRLALISMFLLASCVSPSAALDVRWAEGGAAVTRAEQAEVSMAIAAVVEQFEQGASESDFVVNYVRGSPNTIHIVRQPDSLLAEPQRYYEVVVLGPRDVRIVVHERREYQVCRDNTIYDAEGQVLLKRRAYGNLSDIER